MHTRGQVGRVGGLAVALGVGSAVVLGWGCGIAAADSPDPSTSSATDRESKPTKPKDRKVDKVEKAAKSDKSDADDNSSKPNPPGQSTVPENLGSTVRTAGREALNPTGFDARDGRAAPVKRAVRSAATNRKSHLPAPVDERVDERVDVPVDIDPTKPEASVAEHQASFHAEQITDPPASLLVSTRSKSAATRPPTLEAEHVAVRMVTTVVDSVLNPFSEDPGPPAPAEPPAALAMLAFARREAERSLRGSANQLSSALVTEQAANSIGLAPGIVVPPSLIGHYEVTDAPSLSDRFTVFAMEVLSEISKVIGVNIVTKLGELILSPEPPWFTTIGLGVEKSAYEGGDVWTITPPNPTGEVVVAVHGSGFVYPPNIIHWLDYTQMARQTGATVIVPRYPLIPEGGTAANSVPPMADLIVAQVDGHGAENVSVYGDSAGGTLAMLAVQKIVRDCNGDAGCLAARVPSRMVLVSPGLNDPDFYTDPNVVLVNDPVSGIPDPAYYAQWQVSTPEDGDAIWNTVLGPTEGLPPTTVYIGSREISAPGVLKYGGQLLTANPDAVFHVVIGLGQIHDWAQGGGVPLNSQTGQYRDDVYRQLGIAPAVTG